MGTSTLLDIIGSMVVFGMLLLIVLQVNDSGTANSFTYTFDLLVQENLVAVVDLVEYDFRRLGYCADPTKIPDPSKSIIAADSTSITFLTDVNDDGVLDTMKYYTGPTSELASTPNPNDRFLYRVVNNETPIGTNLGVTAFNLLYFNAQGDTIHFPISVPGEIYTMQISITVENIASYDTTYSTAFWRQVRLVSRNLNNR